jgi:hypothetical protein
LGWQTLHRADDSFGSEKADLPNLKSQKILVLKADSLALKDGGNANRLNLFEAALRWGVF